MNNYDKNIEKIKEYLPQSGKMLVGYRFLDSNEIWTGKRGDDTFITVADNELDLLIVVADNGSVYIADRDSYELINYCSASFPQFVAIMTLCDKAFEDVDLFDEFEDTKSQIPVNTEQELRKQILDIDPSAVADEEGFWCTLIEELANGIL